MNQDLELEQIRVRWTTGIAHPEIEAMKCALWKLDTPEMRHRMEAFTARWNAVHGVESHWIEARARAETPVNL